MPISIDFNRLNLMKKKKIESPKWVLFKLSGLGFLSPKTANKRGCDSAFSCGNTCGETCGL